MTAPVTALIAPNMSALSTTTATPTAPDANAPGDEHDFSRILADRRPAADTDASSSATEESHPLDADASDESGTPTNPSAAPDNLLAELTLAIAAQVTELQGAAHHANQASALPADADAANAAPNTRTAIHIANSAHAALGAAQAGATTNTVTDATTRLSTALSGTAPLPVPTTPASIHHASTQRPTSARALSSDPVATARNAAHTTPDTNRDDAAASALIPRGVSTPGSADHAPQTGHAPAAAFPAITPEPYSPALLHDLTQTRANAAPAASSPPLPAISAPLASPQWGRELGQRLITLTRHADGDTHSAELRLDPPELGPLRVTLTLADGMAQAAFVSPHAHVRHSIEAALDQLQTTLAQSGIELGHTSVSDHHEPHTNAFSAQPRHGVAPTPHTAAPNHAAAPVRHLDTLVDVYA